MQIDPNIVVKNNALQKAKEVSDIYRNPKYAMCVASVIREIETVYKISSDPDPIIQIKMLLIDYIKNVDLDIG